MGQHSRSALPNSSIKNGSERRRWCEAGETAVGLIELCQPKPVLEGKIYQPHTNRPAGLMEQAMSSSVNLAPKVWSRARSMSFSATHDRCLVVSSEQSGRTPFSAVSIVAATPPSFAPELPALWAQRALGDCNNA